MTNSKSIAGLIGPTLIAIAVALFFNHGAAPLFAAQIAREPILIFLSGILLFVAGLAIVRAHNHWTGGWPVLVTVLGWLAILSGLLRMLFPLRLAEIASVVVQNTGVPLIVAAIMLLLGGFLSIKAYRA
jgi:hypothetical protein